MAVKKFLSGEEFSHFFLLSVQTLLPETLFVFVFYTKQQTEQNLWFGDKLLFRFSR